MGALEVETHITAGLCSNDRTTEVQQALKLVGSSFLAQSTPQIHEGIFGHGYKCSYLKHSILVSKNIF